MKINTRMGKSQKTQQEFINEAINVHDGKYDYSSTLYTTTHSKVIIGCPTHGTFEQAALSHIKGSGCKKCADDLKRVTTSEFIATANDIHKNKYDYSHTNYIRNKQKINISCHVHGMFLQYPNIHLQGHGCPSCAKRRGYSKKAISWLTTIAEKENVLIQHAENGGEFQIPDTKYHADGYCKESNTIYEFHGDIYHGNPQIFQPTDNCHPYERHMTAEQLYRKTKKKEECIKNLGYDLIVIWENEWENQYV